MQAGVLAGYPVVDVKVTLYDGSYHEVDSSEMAFKIAGSMAFKEACRKAQPVILEPIMKVAVIVPEEYMGDVIGDITARRGSILGMEPAKRLPRRSTPMCRCPRCSATRPTCAAARRAVASTPWSPATISSCPKSIQEEIVEKRSSQVKNACHFAHILVYRCKLIANIKVLPFTNHNKEDFFNGKAEI